MGFSAPLKEQGSWRSQTNRRSFDAGLVSSQSPSAKEKRNRLYPFAVGDRLLTFGAGERTRLFPFREEGSREARRIVDPSTMGSSLFDAVKGRGVSAP